ncbi:hypothetical protein D9V37_06080 [Nocardioides mangrovicus]|uniref:Uncharacterized protein n=1 Tax=Nocardioides mangrovicus TaxID=2478913 RepID=A0A3L8P374_9ACTN|nr:hypothetical protein [Nocardioides mangrovicus]RLV49501.1 hypothetical protein D9V37_06080 [Nocardioides mangrovicus]
MALDVPAPLADRLQGEVRRLKTQAGRTRSLPTLLHVGSLGSERIVLPVAAVPDDAGSRADVVTRALDRLADPVLRSVWLTRGGVLVVGEADLAWRAAAEAGFARHGVAEPGRWACFVVTRHGWLDVGGGAVRSWPRLRPGPEPAPLAPSRDEDRVWRVLR